jgi:hypothetical protein
MVDKNGVGLVWKEMEKNFSNIYWVGPDGNGIKISLKFSFVDETGTEGGEIRIKIFTEFE